MVRVARPTGGHPRPLRRRTAAVAVALALMSMACGGAERSLGSAVVEQSVVPAGTATDVSLTPTTGGTDDTASSAPDPDDVFVPDPVTWEACGSLDCATVSVPLDHDQPDGPTIELALNRVPATGERRGAILVNPGGPGGSGIGFVAGGFRLDADTMAAYDLVGFDPRGIGASTSVACDLDRSQGPIPDYSPDDDDEAQLLDAKARTFAAECEETDNGLLAHVDTPSVAQDLELLRQALGEEKLNYFGFSFGTLIGLLYAEQYPQNVGHLVFDAVVDPTQDLVGLLTQQALAFEDAFEILDASCDTDLDCPPDGAAAAHDELLRQLEQDGPVGQVGPAELEGAALLSLYDRNLWPLYVTSLSDALGGDFSLVETLSDALAGAVPFGAYAAVSCTDSPRPEGPEAWDRFAAELVELAPRFGAAVANELRTCAYWPLPAGPDREPVKATGAPPILVIGNTNDPATPLANAEAVAANLDSAALVVVEMDGHTAYGASSCVQDLVAAYFLEGVVPSSPARC